jgi:hypothetical protein
MNYAIITCGKEAKSLPWISLGHPSCFVKALVEFQKLGLSVGIKFDYSIYGQTR